MTVPEVTATRDSIPRHDNALIAPNVRYSVRQPPFGFAGFLCLFSISSQDIFISQFPKNNLCVVKRYASPLPGSSFQVIPLE